LDFTFAVLIIKNKMKFFFENITVHNFNVPIDSKSIASALINLEIYDTRISYFYHL